MRMPSFQSDVPPNRLTRLTEVKTQIAELNRMLNGTLEEEERKKLLNKLFTLTEEELSLEFGGQDTRGMTHFTTEEERLAAQATNDSLPQNKIA